MKKHEIIMLIILFMILIIGGFILQLLEVKNKNIIFQNKNDYEIFDKCYLVEERYYCEKSN